MWLRTHGENPQDLIAGLPPSLTGELALQINRKVIEQIAIFKNAANGFKKMLAVNLKPMYIMEGEYVTRVGDLGSNLYLLFRGSVEVQYKNGDVQPNSVRAGRILGEVAFLTGQKSKINYKARENCDLYYLTKTDLEGILDYFPEVRDKIMEEAREGMEREAELRRALEARPKLQNERAYSMEFRGASGKALIKDIVKRGRHHIFRTDSRFIRCYAKFFLTAARCVSISLMLYQACFADFTANLYFVNYLLEFLFLTDVVLRLKLAFLDDFGELSEQETLNNKYIRIRYVLRIH